MERRTKITVLGANGRMGRMLVAAVAEKAEAELFGATARKGSEAVGTDAGVLAGCGALGVKVSDDPAPLIAASDAVIDFTPPEAVEEHARLAAQAGAAYVCGTTGLSGEQEKALDLAARHIPVVYAPNMSVGVTLLSALTEKVAAVLGEEWDIEVMEMHHRHKVDAPSGTALALGKAAAAGRGVDHDERKVAGRDGHTGPRRPGDIGYAVLRGGDVVGEHTVIFAGESERIELTHKAGSRAIFAQGAVRAALWAHGRMRGVWTMRDVLGLGD